MEEKNKISKLLNRLHQNKLSEKQSEYLFSTFRNEYTNDELNEFYLSEWEKSATTGKIPYSDRIWEKTASRLGIYSNNEEKKAKIISRLSFDAGSYIAWKNNILKFIIEEFERIIRKLERWHGVKSDLEYPELKSERFSRQFHLETTEQALNAIACTEAFAFDIKKNIVTI